MRERLPSFQDTLAVFSVVATFVHGWTIVIFLMKLPSWLLFATAGELFAMQSYVFVMAFFESLVVTGLFVAMSLFFPARLFRNDFVVRASWIGMCGYASIMLFLKLNTVFEKQLLLFIGLWSFFTLVLCLILAWVSPRVKFMRSFAEWASDRFQVLLLILLPLSIISLAVVVIRNII